MAVIGFDDRDDLALLHGMARGLDGDVDRFRAARAVDGVLQIARRAGGERLGERGAGQRREMVVAHVEALGRRLHDRDELGIPVAEIVGAAVEVDVDQPAPVHVIEQIALAAVDHEIDALVLPELGLVGVPELFRALQELLLLDAQGTPLRTGLEFDCLSDSRLDRGRAKLDICREDARAVDIFSS